MEEKNATYNEHTDQPRRMLTPREAAEYLKLSVSTVYAYMQRRAIPYYNPGGHRVYIRVEDLNAWQSNNRVATAAELAARAASIIHQTPRK